MQNAVTTLLVLDDHKIFRDGIRAMLLGNLMFKLVGSAATIEDFWAQFKAHTPNIVMLDIQLPNGNGLEIATEIKIKYPITKIIVSTAVVEENVVRTCRAIEVNGLISKESGMETYLEALDAVRLGKTYYSGHFTQLLVNIIGQNLRTDLTPREIDFLKEYVKGHAHKEIADKLNISVRTVEVYKKNIMDKLGFDNNVDLIKYAIKQGYIQL